MKKFLVGLVTVVVGVLGCILPAQSADATTYYWNRTHIVEDSYSLKVKWCSGGTGTLYQNTRTTKNVCGFYLPYNRWIWVAVEETGTTLYYKVAYCGTNAGKWFTFNSRTDTSRTARVLVDKAFCV